MSRIASNRRKVRLQKLLIITICWTVAATLLFLNDYVNYIESWAPKMEKPIYPFLPNLFGNSLFGALTGCLAAAFLVFGLGDKYRRRSFAFGIFNSAILFVVLFNVFAILLTAAFSLAYFEEWELALENVRKNVTIPYYLVQMFIVGFLFVGTQFMLQVNDKFGPGVLWKFLKGKYSTPVEEERIFMFLDLKSSTTIAERIGSTRFFEFLNDCYKDITNPIIQSRGEIYQYVGDEIVISWSIRDGLSNSNCLTCFFQVYEALQARKDYYLDKYDVVPEFKAGMHIGVATVGEIGVIKKDIAYLGDVLNTTARIQAACNQNHTNFLVSSKLLNELDLGGVYRKTNLGEITLRGKEERVELSSVSLS